MISSLFLSVFLFFSPAESVSTPIYTADKVQDSINWVSVETIDKFVSKNIKKKKLKDDKLIMVDFYTDWCGWCKRLDKEAYMDAEVIALVNKYFYALKFDAEQKDSIAFAGKIYNFKKSGSRGTHEFAMAMGSGSGGRIGYPTISFISPMGEKITAEPGYKDAATMKIMLIFYGEGHYKTEDFSSFKKTYLQNEAGD